MDSGTGLERQVLLEIISMLSSDTIELLKQKFAGDMDRYLFFQEAVEAARPADGKSGGIAESWRIFAREGGGLFNRLMDRYIKRYREQERAKGLKGSLADLEAAVSNHSKWHRMMNARGIGNQYRDDMRRVCFVFALSYAEATELLWSAGQPFDPADRRDFAIASCLTKKIYLPDLVDQALAGAKVRPLFDF